MTNPTQSVRLAGRERPLDIEYAWIDAPARDAPLMVFLHEGLGSLAMWKDFPQRLCAALGVRGLVYSREGYGRSTPRPHGERWGPDFMQGQAIDVLPALLAALGIDTARTPPWLFGHSDGGSIALIHAAHFPDRVAGIVALAPHVFVEDISVRSIEAARVAYIEGELRARLARYHDDVDSAFYGWNDVWLDARFRGWNIEALLPRIACPVLAVQGRDDEYGTLAQIESVARHVPGARIVELSDCGHSPQRDQAERLIEITCAFVNTSRAADAHTWGKPEGVLRSA